jgi:hypothetical protein
MTRTTSSIRKRRLPQSPPASKKRKESLKLQPALQILILSAVAYLQSGAFNYGFQESKNDHDLKGKYKIMKS